MSRATQGAQLGRLLRRLVDEGLVDSTAVLDGRVVVCDMSRSNPVGLVEVDGRAAFVVKGGTISADGVNPIESEIAFYRWLGARGHGGFGPPVNSQFVPRRGNGHGTACRRGIAARSTCQPTARARIAHRSARTHAGDPPPCPFGTASPFRAASLDPRRAKWARTDHCDRQRACHPHDWGHPSVPSGHSRHRGA